MSESKSPHIYTIATLVAEIKALKLSLMIVKWGDNTQSAWLTKPDGTVYRALTKDTADNLLLSLKADKDFTVFNFDGRNPY